MHVSIIPENPSISSVHTFSGGRGGKGLCAPPPPPPSGLACKPLCAHMPARTCPYRRARAYTSPRTRVRTCPWVRLWTHVCIRFYRGPTPTPTPIQPPPQRPDHTQPSTVRRSARPLKRPFAMRWPGGGGDGTSRMRSCNALIAPATPEKKGGFRRLFSNRRQLPPNSRRLPSNRSRCPAPPPCKAVVAAALVTLPSAVSRAGQARG